MFDGFNGTVIIEEEKRPNLIPFFSSVDLETGEQREGGGKEGEFETYKLQLLNLKSGGTGIRLNISGSLHKNHQNGTNFEPFSFKDLKSEVLHLSNSLNIDPAKTEIHNLEIGINIPFWLKPFEFLDLNLLVFQNSEFKKYDPDRHGKTIGFYCKKTEYTIKVYDKGLQNNLLTNLLRFEVKFNKMRGRNLKNYGIKTLADLIDLTKVSPLLGVLEKAWSEVLIYDIQELPSILTASQKRFLEDCRYKDYWYKLNKANDQKFRDAKRRFKKLSAKYSSGTHARILKLIQSEWEKLFENFTDFTGCQTSDPTTVFTDFTNTVKGEMRELSPSPLVVTRTCQTCGRDISDQRKDSKFCSETKFGPQAKRCRNKDSNPRNNQKREMDRFYRIGPTLFEIEPYIKKEVLTNIIC
jgi:hypothetical protein